MQERFNTFIASLSDHEFAVFVGHRYEGLLKNKRERVKEEIGARNLTKIQLEKYFSTPLSYSGEAKLCEKCGSNKFFSEKDIEFRNSEHFVTEVEVKTNRCLLCYHNPSKDPEKNIFKRIRRYFVDDNKTYKNLKTYDWFSD